MSDDPAQRDGERAIAQRRRARRRSLFAQRAALAAMLAAAMSATSARSWWMFAALGAFGYWARGRVDAHRSQVGETLGQRSWAIVAQLQDDYSERELEALRMLDARVVVAIESGDLSSIEPLLDEAASILTERDAQLTIHDLRAFVLATQGQNRAANAVLARGHEGIDRPWRWLAERLLASEGSREQPERGAQRWALWDATPPMRALLSLLQRPRTMDAVYRRAARNTKGRVAFESWMLRVAPTLASALPPWPSIPSAMDASWNHPSTAAPIDVPKRPRRDRLRSPWALTILSLAALQALALLEGVALVRAPTAGLVLLFLVPIIGLAVAAAWAWVQRKRESGVRAFRMRSGASGILPARYMKRWEHERIDELLARAGQSDDRALSASREALSLLWSLGSPRDRALLLRRHAVNLAWGASFEESEAVLARMDEDFSSFLHTTTARFEARLVSAVVREDRAAAARIAGEFVDTLPISLEIEALWKTVYAALVDRSLRDEARSTPLVRRESARWLLELLDDERVRVDAAGDETAHEFERDAPEADPGVAKREAG